MQWQCLWWLLINFIISYCIQAYGQNPRPYLNTFARARASINLIFIQMIWECMMSQICWLWEAPAINFMRSMVHYSDNICLAVSLGWSLCFDEWSRGRRRTHKIHCIESNRQSVTVNLHHVPHSLFQCCVILVEWYQQSSIFLLFFMKKH